MKPADPEPADLVPRLRQQLILAQVRIMELEDVRDTLAPRLAELEKLLAQAQILADLKTEEATHSGKVLAESQARAEQLNRLHTRISGEIADLTAKLAHREATIQQLDKSRKQLESELQALMSSPSWRWTAWLRSLTGK